MKPIFDEKKVREEFDKKKYSTPWTAFWAGAKFQYDLDWQYFTLMKDAILAAMHYIALKPYKANFQGVGDINDPEYRAATKIINAVKKLEIR